MSDADNVKAVFKSIGERLDAGENDLGDLSAVYVFKLGEEGGDWSIRIADGGGSVEEGAADDATCTITVAASDFVGLATKKANAQMLFMSGKLKVSGNMGQAMKLQKIL